VPFPTTSLLDNFNRANGALGSNWTAGTITGETGAPTIVSNTAQGGTSGSSLSANWNVTSFGPDSEVYATVTSKITSGLSSGMQLRARYNAGSKNTYTVYAEADTGTDTWTLFKVSNSAYSQLGATFSQEFAVGDAIGLSVVGTTLTAYYKASGGSWTALTTRTDSTFSAAGLIGMELEPGSGTFGSWDDFGGGTVVTATAVPPRLIRSLDPTDFIPMEDF